MSKDLTPMGEYEPTPEIPPLGEQPYALFEDDAEEGGIPFTRYVSALLRYKWLILAAIVLGGVGGVVAGRMVKPQYVARATIWITNNDRTRAADGPFRSEELLRSYAWRDLLRSFTVLDPVVADLRLYLQHAFADSALFRDFRHGEELLAGQYTLVVGANRSYELRHAQAGVVERGALPGAIGSSVGFQWSPPADALTTGRQVSFSVVSPREAAGRLAQQLNANPPPRDGNFMTVELEGLDPVRLAQTLNSVNRHFIEVARDLQRAKLDEQTQILGEQLQQAERNMMEAEIALENFRIQTITLPSDPARPVTPGLEATRDPALTRYFDLRVEREALRHERELLEHALAAEAEDPESLVQRLEAVPSVRQSAELQEAIRALVDRQAERRTLERDYTEEHPTIREADADIARLEEQVLPRLSRQLLAQLRAQEAALDRTLDASAGELREVPPRALEEARLRRDWETKVNLFTELQGRYEEARLSAVSSIPDVRILDQASVPRQPVNGDVPMRLLVMALAGSFAVSIGGVLLWDRVDPRLRYPEQVLADLDLPIIGVIPQVHKERGIFRKGNEGEVREAFRSARLNLMHAYGSAGPVVIAISSPGSGDGKSFVSQQLARVFADLGRRTLLIDGDVRRGHQHRSFDQPRVPGLIDALRQGATLDEVIRPTSIPNFDFIARGSTSNSAPELLALPEMRRALGELKTHYDVILLDTAPLGAGVDPFIIGTLTGNLLLVMRTGETDRHMAATQLEMLRRLPVRVLGTLLNGVETSGSYRYYSYLPEYALPEEDEVVSEDAERLLAAVSKGA